MPASSTRTWRGCASNDARTTPRVFGGSAFQRAGARSSVAAASPSKPRSERTAASCSSAGSVATSTGSNATLACALSAFTRKPMPALRVAMGSAGDAANRAASVVKRGRHSTGNATGFPRERNDSVTPSSAAMSHGAGSAFVGKNSGNVPVSAPRTRPRSAQNSTGAGSLVCCAR